MITNQADIGAICAFGSVNNQVYETLQKCVQWLSSENYVIMTKIDMFIRSDTMKPIVVLKSILMTPDFPHNIRIRSA